MAVTNKPFRTWITMSDLIATRVHMKMRQKNWVPRIPPFKLVHWRSSELSWNDRLSMTSY